MIVAPKGRKDDGVYFKFDSTPLSVCALSPLHLSSSLPLSLSISVCVQRTLSRTSPSTSRSPSSQSCHSKTYVRRHLAASCSPSSCPAAYLRETTPLFLKKRCFLCLSRACLGKRNTFSSRTEVLGHHVRPERRSPVVHAAAVVIRRI